MMMGIIGKTTATIGPLSATSQRRNVNIMLALDHSGPMVGSPLADMQADAVTFVNLFVNNTDSIGLVTYTAAPYVAASLPNLNFQSNVPAAINSMTAPGTGTYDEYGRGHVDSLRTTAESQPAGGSQRHRPLFTGQDWPEHLPGDFTHRTHHHRRPIPSAL